MSDKYRVYYSLDPQYWAGLSTWVDAPDKDTEKFYKALIDKLQGLERRPTTMVLLPCVGADGTPLVQETPSHGITLKREREASMSSVLHALLTHLGVEAVIDETKPYHPVTIRKVVKK